jgi:hypothetical protein
MCALTFSEEVSMRKFKITYRIIIVTMYTVQTEAETCTCFFTSSASRAVGIGQWPPP